MMKKSLPRSSGYGGPNQRASKVPQRVPSMGAQVDRNSSIRRTSSAKSSIPVAKSRSSSADRLSRNVIDLSTKKPSRRSRSLASSRTSAASRASPLGGHRNPQTPSYSGSSYRSRSAERPIRFANIAASKRLETRPVADKFFQHKAMQGVVTFFQSQTADIAGLCPPPNSRSIMIKSFVDMMQFLLQQFFPGTKILICNYVTEIPAYMKKLGYPGNLTTSWLKTANAPHAWPHVVAALSWLVDLLAYEDNSADNGLDKYFCQEKDAIVDSKEFFHYIWDSFVLWNNKEEKAFQELDNNFIADLYSRHVSKDTIKALEAEVADLKLALEDPEEQAAIAEEKALEDEYNMLLKRKRHLQEDGNKMKGSTKRLQKELEDVTWQCGSLTKENEAMDLQRDELEQKIASQKMSVEEAQRMRSKISEMQASYQSVNDYNQSILKMIYSLELQVASKTNQLNKLCVEYNSNILADFSEDKDRLQVEIVPYSETLADQWREVDKGLEDTVSKFKQELKRVKSETKKKVNNANDLSRKRRELLEERNRIKKALNDVESMKQKLKEEARVEEETLKNQYAALKNETLQLVKKMPCVEEAEKQLVAKQERAAQLKKDTAFIQEKGQEFIMTLKKRLDDRLEVSMKKLEDVKNAFRKSLAKSGK